MKTKSKVYSPEAQIVLRVTVITLVCNVLLSAAKLILGLVFENISVISDAVHSVSDVATSGLVIFAVFVSSPKPDKKHNYGHEKVESLLTLTFAVILAAVAGVLIWQGVLGIIAPAPAEMNAALIIVTVLSILSKEAMYWYTIHYAKKVQSALLKADAWHHRSDSLSSVAVLIGLGAGIFTKNNLFESIAVIVVAVLIAKIAFDIFRPALDQLLDRAAADEVCQKIRDVIAGFAEVKALDNLKTRIIGNRIYADIEIAVARDLSVADSHAIAEKLHDTLEESEDLRIKHCMIHVNPYSQLPEE